MSAPIRPIQRGLQNLVANWPLLLVRVGESIVMLVIFAISAFGAIAVAGLGWLVTGWRQIAEDPTRIAEWIVHHPLPLLVGLVVLFLGAGVALVVHAFVFGGAAACWIDGERAAGPVAVSTSSFARFTTDRWLAHCRRTFWPVFLIYNVTWGVFSLILMLPLLALASAILMVGRSGSILPMTCAGLALFVVIAFFGGILVQVWTGLAIVLSAGGQDAVKAPLTDAFRVIAARPAPILVLLVSMTAIGFATSGMFFGVNIAMGFIREAGASSLGIIPVDLGISFVQGVVSLVVSSWMVTGLVTIVEEWRTAGQGSAGE